MRAMWFFSLAALFAMADWYAVEKNISWLRYSAKPLVIVFLGTWLLFQPIDLSVSLWLFLALVFSLIGDGWLLAPARFFMAGLAAFLLAHVCFILGFNHQNLPPATWGVFQLALLFIFLGIFIYPLIFRGIKKKSGTRKLQGAALIYFIIVSVMAFSAVSTLFRPEWEIQTAALAAAGGLLFFFSDFLLAYDRFIRPVKHGRLAVHISYHLGQFGLVLGVAWHMLMLTRSV